MDLGSLLVILALGLLAAAFIAQPLMGSHGLGVTKEDRHLSELQAERDRVLTSLQDLDMDHAMGKVLQTDYQAQRGALISHGAEILREIDEHCGTTGEEISEKDLDVEIETTVARLRRGKDQASGGTCRSCGREVMAGDRFCVHCGASLLEDGT
ncbi:MAG: hypothetical protein AMJ88_02045 [Anaerolineae bacterium SM23_ 63]|nr:MAG: hypothetical protein AMJ88_02045 [Anaerolineae bacterium SM23_ 63]HEY46467.1 zinc ribbon domain-containing protein [Anaerolineae bacterium]